jgi:hypothetical protein
VLVEGPDGLETMPGMKIATITTSNEWPWTAAMPLRPSAATMTSNPDAPGLS